SEKSKLRNIKIYIEFYDFQSIRDPEVLNEYKVLIISENNGEKFIINPYQIIKNKIQLTNLNDLSMLVTQYKGNNKISYENVLSSYESLKEKIEKECKEYLD
ncbi:TPA: histidine kinase, partial [Acinetobacter baumannii]